MALPRSGRAAKARVESGAQAAAVVPRKARRLGRSWEPMATSGWAPAGCGIGGRPAPVLRSTIDQGQAKSNCERWIAGDEPGDAALAHAGAENVADDAGIGNASRIDHGHGGGGHRLDGQ